ncbi:hypothetical protein HN51_063046 [Arachis hypogaea]
MATHNTAATGWPSSSALPPSHPLDFSICCSLSGIGLWQDIRRELGINIDEQKVQLSKLWNEN